MYVQLGSIKPRGPALSISNTFLSHSLHQNYALNMKLSSFVTLAVLTVSAVSQDAPNVLIYGSVGSQEDQAAIELGYNTTIVTDSEWANMSTLDFARYDAVVVPDLNSGSIISLDFLEKSKDIWSPAITGSIIVIGESTGYLSSRYWS